VVVPPRARLRTGRRQRAPTWLWVPAGMTAVAMLLPIVYLVVRAIRAGGQAVAEFTDPDTLHILWNSAQLAVLVTGASILLAVPIAWLTVRTDLPGRAVWAVLCAVPLVIPSYVGAFAYVAAFGPRGLLQALLAPRVQRLPEIYGLPGAVLTLTLFTFPYLLLIVRGALVGMDPSLEEASRGLGYSPFQTFRRVTLAHLRPALGAGGLLVTLYVLSDFGAVSIMKLRTFTFAIYLEYQGAFDRTRMAVLALVLIAVACVILAAEARARGRIRYDRTGVGTRRQAPIVALGRWRWPALALCIGVVALALAVPAMVIGYWLVRGIRSGQELSLAFEAARSSVWVSSLAAGLAAVAALPLAVLSVRFRSRITTVMERVTYVGFTLPPIVIALAFVFFGARYLRGIYATLVLLVVAYAVRFLPEAVGATRTSLLQVPPSIEEAARSLGRSGPQVLASVTTPLVLPGVMAGAALVFLTAMKDLPITLLLSPPGFSTLATQVWSATDGAFYAKAAVHALPLLLLSSVPLTILVRRPEYLFKKARRPGMQSAVSAALRGELPQHLAIETANRPRQPPRPQPEPPRPSWNTMEHRSDQHHPHP
jgi:iron(III) transport system permease protein